MEEIPILKEKFIFQGINVFQVNRLDAAEELYYQFLKLFSIIKLMDELEPKKIIITSSVINSDKHLILIAAKEKKISYRILYNPESWLRTILKQIKAKVRIIIDYFWFWHIWKFFNRKNINCNIPDNSKKINLILWQYENFYPSLNQVLKKLDKENKILNIIYVQHKIFKLAKDLLKSEGIKNSLILPIYDTSYKEYRQNYNKSKEILKEIIKSDSFNNLSIDGISIKSICKFLILGLFDKFILSLRLLKNFKIVIKRLNPNLISVMSGNDPYDILITRIAKKFDIPTLFFPHALMAMRWDLAKLEQDYIVCAGERDKNEYTSIGTDPSSISVLGIPSFDKFYSNFQIYKEPLEVRKKIINLFKINSEKKIILLVTTFHEDYKRRQEFISVINVIKEIENSTLIVKIHPLEDTLFYHDILNQLEVKGILIIEKPILHDLIVASNLVIGSSSNAQIEALLLDKNVIDLIFDRSSGIYQMEKYNAVIPVFNPNKLKDLIKKALYDEGIKDSLKKGRNEYLKYCLYKYDGQASNRVVALIKNILEIS